MGAIRTQQKTQSAMAVSGPAAAASFKDLVVNSLEDDKAQAITVIDLAGKSTLADYMVIASGTSARHLSAISDHLVERLKAADAPKAVVDGKDQGDWVLIDAGDVIVHLFRPEVREFYNLEKLWNAGSAPKPTVVETVDEPHSEGASQ
ncbi:ribosome silencing factor [Hwanghaeella sp.]|uniref:ribosome silencing factor n=1 Tax=Hwanghaeella sp. TaxID=2605943 RepID=UPI003CCBD1DA